MRVSISIVLATVSIAFSTAAFAAESNPAHQPTLLSPIIVYPSDTKVAANTHSEPVLHTGRSSSKDMGSVRMNEDASQKSHHE